MNPHLNSNMLLIKRFKYIWYESNHLTMRNIVLFFISVFFTMNAYSQYTGATPWSNCFGPNAGCSYVGCSDIKVITSKVDPVVAIVKQYGKIKKHAYISANSSYTFEVLDGTYQVYFYYGDNWNSSKVMSSSECYNISGGFSSNEFVSKDDPITLNGQVMEYTLSKMTHGNFSPKSSNLKEAL